VLERFSFWRSENRARMGDPVTREENVLQC
jgi:hypothetical protein